GHAQADPRRQRCGHRPGAAVAAAAGVAGPPRRRALRPQRRRRLRPDQQRRQRRGPDPDLRRRAGLRHRGALQRRLARRPAEARRAGADLARRRTRRAVADRQGGSALGRERHHPRDEPPPSQRHPQPARPRSRRLLRRGRRRGGEERALRPPRLPSGLGRPVRQRAARPAPVVPDRAADPGPDVRAAVQRLRHGAPCRPDPAVGAARGGRRLRRHPAARHDAERVQRGRLHRPVRRGDPERHHHGRQPQPLARPRRHPAAGGAERRARTLPPGADHGDGGGGRPAAGRRLAQPGQRRAAAAGHGDHRRPAHRHRADPAAVADLVLLGRDQGAAPPQAAAARPRPQPGRLLQGGGRMNRRLLRPPLLCALLLPLLAAAADATPAAATFNDDGSVGEVHDGRSLRLAAPEEGWTVQASAQQEQELSWPMFIREVLASNLDYAAARYNVDMAQADAVAARLLPNPTLNLAGDRDLNFHGKYAAGTDGRPARLQQPENRAIGIDQTVEWWGKRHWRIKAADQSLRAAAATLEDFLRNLKLDAAAAFADALAAQRGVDQLRAASAFLEELAQAQEARYKAGDIGRPDLLQTQVEHREFLNDLSRAEDDAEAARYALSTFLGRNRGQTAFVVRGELKQVPRDYPLPGLIAESLQKRADLVALRHARDAAQSGLKMARAAVIPDVDLSLSYGYN